MSRKGRTCLSRAKICEKSESRIADFQWFPSHHHLSLFSLRFRFNYASLILSFSLFHTFLSLSRAPVLSFLKRIRSLSLLPTLCELLGTRHVFNEFANGIILFKSRNVDVSSNVSMFCLHHTLSCVDSCVVLFFILPPSPLSSLVLTHSAAYSTRYYFFRPGVVLLSRSSYLHSRSRLLSFSFSLFRFVFQSLFSGSMMRVTLDDRNAGALYDRRSS